SEFALPVQAWLVDYLLRQPGQAKTPRGRHRPARADGSPYRAKLEVGRSLCEIFALCTLGQAFVLFPVGAACFKASACRRLCLPRTCRTSERQNAAGGFFSAGAGQERRWRARKKTSAGAV